MRIDKFLLSAWAALAFSPAFGFDFVKDGVARPIVLSEKAHPSSELAAKELADYTEKATGVRPEVRVRGQGQEWSDKN